MTSYRVVPLKLFSWYMNHINDNSSGLSIITEYWATFQNKAWNFFPLSNYTLTFLTVIKLSRTRYMYHTYITAKNAYRDQKQWKKKMVSMCRQKATHGANCQFPHLRKVLKCLHVKFFSLFFQNSFGVSFAKKMLMKTLKHKNNYLVLSTTAITLRTTLTYIITLDKLLFPDPSVDFNHQ